LLKPSTLQVLAFFKKNFLILINNYKSNRRVFMRTYFIYRRVSRVLVGFFDLYLVTGQEYFSFLYTFTWLEDYTIALFSLNHVWLIGCRILLVLPITISYMWNFGSLLGMCLILQILRKKYLRSRLSKTLWVWV